MDHHAENSLISELMILAVNYTHLRRGNTLWQTPGKELLKHDYKTYLQNENLIIFGHDEQDKTAVVIRRCKNPNPEFYYLDDIILRMAIKR